MINKTKFQIDTTILNICENKKINIKHLIKNTTQYIMMLDLIIDEDINEVLHFFEEEYKNDKRQKLTLIYHEQWIKITESQKKCFFKIKQENRTYLFNELISIAINSSYFNYTVNNLTFAPKSKHFPRYIS
jgi:hypothetical protein